MNKKLISAVLAVCMLLPLLPPAAFAADANAIAIADGQMSILPYCAGDTIAVPVTCTGETPKQVALYVDGNPADVSAAAPFTTAMTNVQAGTHSLFVRATYADDTAVDSAAIAVEVQSARKIDIYADDFDNRRPGANAGIGGVNNSQYLPLTGAEADDLALAVIATDADSSQLVVEKFGEIAAANVPKLAISADMEVSEKKTQRGLEIKVKTPGSGEKDLILFRFKNDGSWAFTNGRKNTQYTPGNIYHVEMLLNLENQTYDCLLLENGRLLYRDTGLTLSNDWKIQSVIRMKIQQNAGANAPTLKMDNVRMSRYEAVRITTITQTHEMVSPDGMVTGALLEDSDGCVWYRAAYDGVPVLEQSPLGLVLDEAHGGALDNGFTVAAEEPVIVAGAWEPLYGTMESYPENYTEYVYHVTEQAGSGRQMDIVFRLYNEGLAFRYVLPAQNGLDGYTIVGERTGFDVAGNPDVWYQKHSETIPFHKKASDIGTESGIQRPMTLLYDGAGAALVESDMYGYARMHMDKVSSSLFRAHLAGDVKVQAGEGDKHTPWRAMILGKNSAEVLQRGYLVENLAPEAGGAEYEGDLSWITPGKAVRVANGFSYDNACKHVDFAVERGLQYIMFDAGWYGPEREPASDPRYPINDTVTGKPLDIKAITDYAHARGIKLVVYINNIAIFEEYKSATPRYTTDQLLQTLSGWGVDGLKPGFVDCDTQDAERWNLDLARTAAKYHMTVNSHDLYVPAGINRTYPNFVGAESVWGDEHADIMAERDLTQFFTRYVQGPADHTWCWYNYRVSKAFRLASAVMSYTPQQYMFWYEGPQSYAPGDARELQFWKDVPAVWDDTKILEGEIGAYLTVARRSGSEWFIGAGSAVNRTLTIPLDFLPDGEYIAEIYKNGPNDYFDITVADPQNPVSQKTVNGKTDTVVIEKRLVDRETVLTNEMKHSFGYAVRLFPATQEDIAALHYVEITSPMDGATMEPQDLNLQVNVGSGAAKVEYYSNNRLIGTADAAPFQLVYPNPGEGMYALTAKAYYENGAVAETQRAVVVGLAAMAESVIVSNDFNGKSFSGIDISLGSGGAVYKPMNPENKEDFAAVITTGDDRAHQINFVPSPPLNAANETKLRMQADFMFSDNVVTRGLFEIRRKGAAEDNPILVSLSGGNISVRGGSTTVPYQANRIYNFKIVLDMKSWTYDCEIRENGRLVFDQAALSIGAGSFQTIERVKLQQEAVSGGVTSSEMYIDNYEIARYVAAPGVTGIAFTTAAGDVSTAVSGAPLDTVKIALTFSAGMKAASFADAVRVVKMPEEIPVAFTGIFANGAYEITLGERLTDNADYRVYFDGVQDANGVPSIPGYFTAFHTARQAFGLDSFLCMSGGRYVSNTAAIAPGSAVSVFPSVRNETADRKTVQVIVCVHNANGMLKGGAAKQFTLAAGETLKGAAVDFTAYDGISGTDSLSVYVWDGLRTMRPLSPALGF